jgi:hypothetical protein
VLIALDRSGPLAARAIYSAPARLRAVSLSNFRCDARLVLKKPTYLLLLILIASSLSLGSGCVRRRLTVRTAPAGATLYVDDQPIGETPVSTPFTYYGTRKIQIVKDNFETLTVKQVFNPPWYQYPVIDFIAENLWPWEIRDERVVDFQMIPQQIVPTERLLENGQQLRDSAAQGAITPGVTAAE